MEPLEPWDDESILKPTSNRSKLTVVLVVAVVLIVSVVACCLVVRTLVPLYFLNLDPKKVP